MLPNPSRADGILTWKLSCKAVGRWKVEALVSREAGSTSRVEPFTVGVFFMAMAEVWSFRVAAVHKVFWVAAMASRGHHSEDKAGAVGHKVNQVLHPKVKPNGLRQAMAKIIIIFSCSNSDSSTTLVWFSGNSNRLILVQPRVLRLVVLIRVLQQEEVGRGSEDAAVTEVVAEVLLTGVMALKCLMVHMVKIFRFLMSKLLVHSSVLEGVRWELM